MPHLRTKTWLDLESAAVVEVTSKENADPGRVRTAREFVLRWFSDGGYSFREIVGQQWNFSPPETTREVEDYRVELSQVTVLELVVVPDKSRGAGSRASLKSLRLA